VLEASKKVSKNAVEKFSTLHPRVKSWQETRFGARLHDGGPMAVFRLVNQETKDTNTSINKNII